MRGRRPPATPANGPQTAGRAPQVPSPRCSSNPAQSAEAGIQTPYTDFQPGQVYWFNQRSHIKVFSSRQHSECSAGRVLLVSSAVIQWEWLYAPATTVSRHQDILYQQKPILVSALHQDFLAHDPTLTLRDVLFLLSSGTQPVSLSEELFTPCSFDLAGFKSVQNVSLWNSQLHWVQHVFDPKAFLIRRINAEAPPKGKPQQLWVQCIRALVHLQKQTMNQQEDGTYVPDPLFDKLTMLSKCLPILLLRVPSTVQREAKASIIIKNCQRFLNGAWRSLAITALQDLQASNILALGRNHVDRLQPPEVPTIRHEQALDKARQLLYSKAMNLLRSPGLARQPLDDILDTMQQLHPAEPVFATQELRPPDEDGVFTPSTFNFITGEWFARQIRASSKGTAVDQWGWDSREMWEPLIYDKDLLADVAEVT